MTTTEQNREIQETVHSERKRLLDFIRRCVPSSDDVEDVLQEAFYELFEIYRFTSSKISKSNMPLCMITTPHQRPRFNVF
jgi:DNA-directed RNA polymerase specialized sigma24 family protein